MIRLLAGVLAILVVAVAARVLFCFYDLVANTGRRELAYMFAIGCTAVGLCYVAGSVLVWVGVLRGDL